MNEYKRICPRCNTEKVYKKPYYGKYSNVNNCIFCHNIPDELIGSFIVNNQTYIVKCNRCNHEKTYKFISKRAKYNITIDRCNICDIIPDELIAKFLETGKYPKKCNVCNGFTLMKTKSTYLYSLSQGLQCKTCSNRQNCANRAEELRNEWEPIIGYWNIGKRMFNRIRKHWLSLNKDKQQELLNKTILQRKYYWEHLKRANKVVSRINLKKSFEKYKGKNHWIHRPETWAKIYDAIKWESVKINDDGTIKKLRNYKIKGVENLLKEYDDVELDLSKVPVFSYKYRGEDLSYKTGIHIPSENQSVEVKSAANIYPRWNKYISRWSSILDSGYNLKLVIYDKDRQISVNSIFNNKEQLLSESNNLKSTVRSSAYHH